MLDLKNLSKSFDGGNFEVLKDINISIKKGKFVCVLGPSGCGKTILLYLVAGFIKPTKGKVLMENKEITKPDNSRMMVFQDYVLFPWKNVYENVLFALDNSKLDKDEKHKLVMRYLHLVGIDKFKDWYPYKLSGGMQQRVAFARALVTDPQVLLMDEPFSALDSQYRKFLRINLEKIWRKTKQTIVFVTHIVSDAIFLADEIYLLSIGPACIKKKYEINLPRPRNVLSKGFIELKNEIEGDLKEEFQKILKNPKVDESLSHILKLTGQRGIL